MTTCACCEPSEALSSHERVVPHSADRKRWATILAGGDGTRLQGLTRFLFGVDRPKQFCAFVEGETLLAETRRRVAMSVAEERTLFALTEAHREYFETELAGLDRQWVVQPGNRGTAPPILYCLKSIAAIDPQAVVAVLPSDHHYRDEAAFHVALELAYAAAEDQAGSLILLGASADRLELEYGWIELGAEVNGIYPSVHRVKSFWEKPSKNVAEELMREGAAWNTFVMVGQVNAYLEIASRTVPVLMQGLEGTRLWQGTEDCIEAAVYESLPACDFSHEVLARDTAHLLVQYERNLGWSDLGQPARVMEAMRDAGVKAAWIDSWNERKQCDSVRGAGNKFAVA